MQAQGISSTKEHEGGAHKARGLPLVRALSRLQLSDTREDNEHVAQDQHNHKIHTLSTPGLQCKCAVSHIPSKVSPSGSCTSGVSTLLPGATKGTSMASNAPPTSTCTQTYALQGLLRTAAATCLPTQAQAGANLHTSGRGCAWSARGP